MEKLFIKKIENKYTKMARNILDKNGFVQVEIIENKTEPMSWLVFQWDKNDEWEDEVFNRNTLKRQVLNTLKKVGF